MVVAKELAFPLDDDRERQKDYLNPRLFIGRMRNWSVRLRLVKKAESFEEYRDRMYDQFNQEIAKQHPEYVHKMQTTSDPELQKTATLVRIDRISH